MEHTIIFNHIPRTGGTTLRVILNKIYGEERVFFINSRDIPSSLERFRSMGVEARKRYKVISGHGAIEYSGLVEKPFRITILRDPLSLFISQYYYLRESHNSNFREEVRKLDSFGQYLGYALVRGQDNMMTRLMDPANKQLYLPDKPPPLMDAVGDAMLINARNELLIYDAVIELDNFDRGIYALSKLLGWKSIPLYRPLNKSARDDSVLSNDASLKEKVMHVLRYDLALYDHFMRNNYRIGDRAGNDSSGYSLFILRQRIMKMISRVL